MERIAQAVTETIPDPLTAVLAAEPEPGDRLYLCAFGDGDRRSWLVVDDDACAVVERRRVRDTVAIAALCEIATDAAFPGDLDQLRQELVQLRITEVPPGIEDAEGAALTLQRVLGSPPQLATPARLDEIGAATRRLELALDPAVPSPSAAAMLLAPAAVDELVAQVESGYRHPLDG